MHNATRTTASGRRWPMRLPTLSAAGLAALAPGLAAATPAAPDSGDTAWILTATALVVFMAIPGLALFYGGLVRAKNVLSVLMQVFAVVSVISLLWVLYGYSLAFDTTGMEEGVVGRAAFIGTFANAGMLGLARDSLTGTIPEALFAAFQMSFAAITPALIVGAFAERVRFGPMLAFSVAWFTFGYLPIAHMTWAGAGGLFWDWGVIDFAGGTVVHVNAGIAGLVAALVIGPRRGFPVQPMTPHNLGYTMTGAAMLWVGWFGFNAGSALAAGSSAAMALLVTHVAAAAGVIGWLALEWPKHGKPSVLGAASGAVAGLVAITPAAGVAGPLGAIGLGLVAGALCFVASTSIKRAFRYDDSLDVFGVHGVGGVVGALLTGVVAHSALGGAGLAEGVSITAQVGRQAAALGVTILWSGLVTWLALVLIRRVVGLRVDPEAEVEGLDLRLHDERGLSL
jgi:Amt family ammonium transporter